MQLFAIAYLLLGNLISPNTSDADKINGYWISPDKDLIVKCYKGVDGNYHGKMAWFKVYNSEEPSYDCDIPESQWVGSTVLSGFTYENNEWNNGKIIDIKKCNTYDAFIQMQPDGTLKATGFILFRWLSESIIFSKYEGKLPVQH